jgi:hypothetical protein
MAVEHGLHVLRETPIAHKLSEADAIIAAAAQRGLKSVVIGGRMPGSVALGPDRTEVDNLEKANRETRIDHWRK